MDFAKRVIENPGTFVSYNDLESERNDLYVLQ